MMKKMLIVFGSGGHSDQALLLLEKLKDHFEVEVMIDKKDPLSKKRLPKNIVVHEATAIRGKRENVFTLLYRMVVSSFRSLQILFQSRPDVLLSTGPGFSGPILILGKIFGKKVIFVESWSRVTTKSWPGRFLYFISDRFFVQWPEMKQKYKKAVYAGRLG